MQFVVTKEYITELQDAISAEDKVLAKELVKDLHPVDVELIFDELNLEDAKYLFLLLEEEVAADVLAELEDDDLLRFIEVLPAKTLAKQFIPQMNSDDAADVIGHMSDHQREAVLSYLEDKELLGDIVDLLTYPEDSAGGIMAKEMVVVKENDTIRQCLQQLAKEAEDIDGIYYLYAVNDFGILKGVLSLKDLILNKTTALVSDIYKTDIVSVKTNMEAIEVATTMSKYDLVVLPVVDSLGRLVGRITIDDAMDVAKEESDRDYQMMSGLTEDVESSDGLPRQVRARLPWLIVGLMGGVFGAMVIGVYEEDLAINPTMAFFLPLITGMGGNVGVQSSAIIVQSLANNTLGIKRTSSRLLRELFGALVMGVVCSLLLYIFNYFYSDSQALTFAASTSLLIVMVFASIFGTFIPLFLHRLKIDPALATGPFITTLNDIVGLFCYLYIGKIFFDYFSI